MDLPTPDQEWKKGSAELLVLSLLEDQRRHGYDIARLIEVRSGGAVRFHVTTLYPLLSRLRSVLLLSLHKEQSLSGNRPIILKQSRGTLNLISRTILLVNPVKTILQSSHRTDLRCPINWWEASKYFI